MKMLSYLGAVLRVLWKILTGVRVALGNLLFLLALGLVLAAVLAEKKETVPPGAVLVIDPSGSLVDESVDADPSEAALRLIGRDVSHPGETRAQDIVEAVRTAATDPAIAAIVIDPDDLQGCDTSKLLVISRALRTFRESGKPVMAYATMYTQGQYLLASPADTIALASLGGVAVTGFGAYQTYFKGLLDKLGVTFHVFRVGDYKSAVEPFIRGTMSDEARDMNRKWLDGLWSAYLDEVARNRALKPEQVNQYAQTVAEGLRGHGGNAARLAVDARLVDQILPRDKFDQLLAERISQDPKALHHLGFRDYLRLRHKPEAPSRECIAIIRGRGAIVPGQQPEDMIGSESIAKLLDKARNDSSVVAVVLRLDSPGGSATASEEIHNEIQRTQAAGKPVVVSMGSVAASGAYWIATAANRIVAEPTTLTGSIGIFAAFPSFENAAAQWGVTTDGVGTTPLADLGNPLRPLGTPAADAIQQLLQFGYTTFLDRVAVGRKLSTAQVQALAQGRVFIGREAARHGLVDQLGDLDDAVKAAGSLCGLNDPAARELRRERSPHELLLQGLTATRQAVNPDSVLQSIVSRMESQARQLASFADPGHLYARSLECEASVH